VFIYNSTFDKGECFVGTKERRETEIEAFRSKIFDAASRILIDEGYEKLSIRKIAKIIDYSPGAIYHYFSSKAEILLMLYEENEKKIAEKLIEIPIDESNPEDTYVNVIKTFINLTLEVPDHYTAVFLNPIEILQDKVGMLREESISENFVRLYKVGIEAGKFDPYHFKTKIQLIWIYTNGLISRLVLEDDISIERRNLLIENHCSYIKDMLLLKNNEE
jgi:AcrR family transcriptional regulator